jgi:2-oxo-4-hydroxy-4-carboxy-5-ureidoimidazoline decarboxylase
MQLQAFNGLPRDEARAAIDPCLGVARWVEEVVDGRPYDDVAALRAQAATSGQHLTGEELASALSRHPRIGEPPPSVADHSDVSESAFSRREQAGVDAADVDTAERLRQANKEYEARFGRVFLIRAVGRSSEEILSELHRRLRNDDDAEHREVVRQLREIALLRLDQVVTQ